MPHRPPFDPKRPLVAARGFRFAGLEYVKGDPFPGPRALPVASFSRRLIQRQYDTGAVNFADRDEPKAKAKGKSANSNVVTEGQIKMTGPDGGRYRIEAPWLDEPLVLRGKTLADQAFAKAVEDGPPLGWIDGGTEVLIEETGGGWYQVSAPWLEEPEKHRGREDAEKRQRELHEAGPPDGWSPEDGASGANDQKQPEGADDADASKTKSAEAPEDGADQQGADGSGDSEDGAGDGQAGQDGASGD